MTHNDDQSAPRQQGKLLFWRGYTCSEIARPLGNAPVWLGYDPSHLQDDASLVVVAPPTQ